ncbi:hypothetical protein AALP_AA1G054300 [Arabis alpina]|uniref:Jacalin-type lectin domain-containing protein n=1 Tax=Arabis alpina TaxID=50452 RepID=A0A087HLA7_ARAAL|nr:hypothetical protein AALP_AA1G054300 [Arabis alpina]
MQGKIKIGPVGGNPPLRSTTIVDWDEGSHNGVISQIFLSHGSSGIMSIQFQFVLDDKFVLSHRYGRNTGSMFDVISLNWPNEYISGISGVHGDAYGPRIKSLKFTTNTNEYGPFGCSITSSMEKFDLKLGKFRQFGGFFGKCDASGLHNIGKIKIGPVGNRDPKTAAMVGWDEGSRSGIISQIFISHSTKGILSIQFQYMLDDDKFALSDQHGRHSGSKFDIVSLNCPHEYITGISGEYSTYLHGKSPHILSLKIATNTSEYGPFGYLSTNCDEKFEFKMGKFSQFGGFYGTYDSSGLHHIGVYLQPTSVRPKSKPKTGTSSANFAGIFAIQFQFMLDDDKFILSDHHGRNIGSKFDAIAFNYPHEYITGISGEYCKTSLDLASPPHIRRLKFTTNTNEVLVIMEGKMKIGPVGKHDVRSTTIVNWDEGSHNGNLSQIFLSHGVSGIMSIQFQFLTDGKLVLSDRHGPFSGNMFDVIELNYPNEYITGISGEYYKHQYDASNPHIRSLKFTTNTSEYGPFGTSNPGYDKFAFKLGKSPQFGGFHGTYDASGLQYIGVYLQPKKDQPKINTNNSEEMESKIVLG